jgi:hypothetical protein
MTRMVMSRGVSFRRACMPIVAGVAAGGWHEPVTVSPCVDAGLAAATHAAARRENSEVRPGRKRSRAGAATAGDGLLDRQVSFQPWAR